MEVEKRALWQMTKIIEGFTYKGLEIGSLDSRLGVRWSRKMKFHARIKYSVLSYLKAMLQGDATGRCYRAMLPRSMPDIFICGMYVLADPALQIIL